MMNTGKCPKCEKTVSTVNIEHVDINESFRKKWHGVSLVCSHCDAVLGVAIDPIAMKNDVVSEILEGLGKVR